MATLQEIYQQYVDAVFDCDIAYIELTHGRITQEEFCAFYQYKLNLFGELTTLRAQATSKGTPNAHVS